jgi:DNA-binding response OmpR family regulator
MSIHIVHIEDDKPLKEILKIAFEAADPTVNLKQFISAEDALPYVEQHAAAIDLFILDIRLPGSINGLQMAQKLRDLQCPGFIVLTSAYLRPSREMLTGLRSEYYPKPWHIYDITPKLLQYRLPPKPSADPQDGGADRALPPDSTLPHD